MNDVNIKCDSRKMPQKTNNNKNPCKPQKTNRIEIKPNDQKFIIIIINDKPHSRNIHMHVCTTHSHTHSQHLDPI